MFVKERKQNCIYMQGNGHDEIHLVENIRNNRLSPVSFSQILTYLGYVTAIFDWGFRLLWGLTLYLL